MNDEQLIIHYSKRVELARKCFEEIVLIVPEHEIQQTFHFNKFYDYYNYYSAMIIFIQTKSFIKENWIVISKYNNSLSLLIGYMILKHNGIVDGSFTHNIKDQTLFYPYNMSLKQMDACINYINNKLFNDLQLNK